MPTIALTLPRFQPTACGIELREQSSCEARRAVWAPRAIAVVRAQPVGTRTHGVLRYRQGTSPGAERTGHPRGRGRPGSAQGLPGVGFPEPLVESPTWPDISPSSEDGAGVASAVLRRRW